MDTIITRSSALPFEEVCRRLAPAAAAHQFGVLGTHDLKEKITAKGLPFARECRVFEVCNPRQAQQILSEKIEVSSALPCRISAYCDGDKTLLATIRPAALLRLFGGAGDAPVAREVEDALVKIMEEACGPTVARS